jgi:hypothetical protein
MQTLKNYWLVALLYFVAFFSYGGNYWHYHWFLKWATLMSVLVLPVAYATGKRFHWSASLPVISTLGTGLFVFAWRDNPYSQYQLLDQIAIHKTVAYTTFTFLMLLTFFLVTKRETYRQIKGAYALFCLINSVAVIYYAILGRPPYYRGTIIGNASMTSSLIGITYPWVVEQCMGRGMLSIPMLLLPISAVWALESTMGVGVLLVSILAMFWVTFGRQAKAVFLGAAVSLTALFTGAGWVLFGQGDGAFFRDSGRFSRWQAFMVYWLEYVDWKIGAGPGTSEVLLPYIQMLKGEVANEFFLWFHGDVLQLIFEQGALGAISFLVVAFFAVRAAQRNVFTFSSLMAYLACTLGNYPVHLPLHAFLGFALFAMSFEGERSWTETTITPPQAS